MKGTTYDLPLTDKGHQEAEQTAHHLAQYPIGSIRHSDMIRGTQTTKHIENATGVKSEADERLDPWDVGYLAGQSKANAQARVEYYIKHPDKPIPEGQSYGDWFDSYEPGFRDGLKRAQAQPDKAHVLVTHSCGLMASQSIIKGEQPGFHGEEQVEAPGGIMKLTKSGGRWNMSDVDLANAASR